MANQTVYPYGQSGQLPLGYPIADDLNTNSAQQALAAKQGVVLKGMVEDTYIIESVIDVNGYSKVTTYMYINKTDNEWRESSNQSTRSFFVPIKANTHYKIIANASYASRVAILKSNTTTENTTPDYATGETELHEISAGQAFDFITPTDAAYLNINDKLSGNNNIPSAMYLYVDKMASIDEKITGQPLSVITHTYIDARTSSATFGKSVSATNDDWAATEFLDICEAKFIRVFTPTYSTSNNYSGKAGLVFYDADRQPISSGVMLLKQGQVSIAEWVELQVPAGAKYVRFSAFSSFAGKYLFVPFNKSEIPVTRNSYYGDRVSFVQPTYSISQIVSNSVAGQSSAIYGKYLFIVKDKLTNVILYDMESRSVIYNLTTGITSETYWHCNQSSFSTEKYDADDMFPVLYISMQNNPSGRGEIHGYRIIPVLSDGEVASFTITLVQTIYLPIMTDENCLGNPNATFDTTNGFLWTYSRNNNASADNYNRAMFTKFAVPSLSNASVTLEDSDIIESFPDDWSMLYAQGGCIVGGKLVIMQGYASAGFIYARVIDLYARKRQIAFFDLYSNGFTAEPEGVFYYDGNIYTSVNGAGIYKLILD